MNEHTTDKAEGGECPSGGEHYWLLRPESDTHECAFCGDER